MFDFFKNIGRREYPTWKDVPPPTDIQKIADDMSKVVPFPELKLAPPPAPKEEPAGKTCYSIGLTDDDRVSLIVGYSSITMNSVGVQQMIEQLELFKRQIESNEEQ
jgi:hypothetical protein